MRPCGGERAAQETPTESARRRACGAPSHGGRAVCGSVTSNPYGVEGSLARATARRRVRLVHSPTGNVCFKKGAKGIFSPIAPSLTKPSLKGRGGVGVGQLGEGERKKRLIPYGIK